MRQSQLLFLALSRKGWGETSLGVEVAKQVRDAGGTVSFLAHSGSMPALVGAGFNVQEVPDHMGPLLELVIRERLASEKIDAIVLSDFLTTNYTMSRWGLDPKCLLELSLPLIAIDTWQYETTGPSIDILGNTEWAVGSWIERLPYRIVPVPIGHANVPGAYCSVPRPLKIPRRVRSHIRDNMGFCDKDRIVLFCTAVWQHTQVDPDARRIADALPHLLWAFLSRVHPAVQFVHIGPERLPLDSNDRYHWLAPMSPDNFDRMLGSADLFLSTNISATTIGRAMAMSIPIIVVQNPRAVATSEDPLLSPIVRSWLEGAAPLYPFALWPLGYWSFLEPLLRDNPYSRAIERINVLDEASFTEACRRLLFDESARTVAVARQENYVSVVRQLPSAADLIGQFLC